MDERDSILRQAVGLQPETQPRQPETQPRRPETQPRQKLQGGTLLRIVAGFLAVALVFGLLSLCGVIRFGRRNAGGKGRLEGSGFDSGAEAVLALAQALKSCDVDALLSCYAIESWCEHFSFEGKFSYEDYNTQELWYDFMPEDSAFGRSVNEHIRLFGVCSDAASLFQAAASGCFADRLDPAGRDGALNGYYLKLWNEETAPNYETYLAAMQNGEVQRLFRGMTIGSSIDITSAVLEARPNIREKREQLLEDWRLAIGADAVRDYGVAINVDGLDCYLTATTACYGGRWYILNVGSWDMDYQNAVSGFCLALYGIGED